MVRYAALVLFFTFFATFQAGCGPVSVSEGTPKREKSIEATVTRVVDGDTVEVRPAIDGEEDVRLIGVDTPEKAGSPRGAQPYAQEASGFARRELEERRVTLRFGTEKKDRYGRVLAYLYLPDGSMFNETLVEKGYAQVATFPPNVRYVGHFEKAQREARESGRGIWGLSKRRQCRLTDRGNGIGGCRK